MANSLQTQKKVIALALGAVTEMSYLYAGADKGIETEMQGKDNGDTIYYKITQLGEPEYAEDISDNGSADNSLEATVQAIKQVTVPVKMNDSYMMVKLKAFERQVTSIGEALAKAEYGAKLGEKAVKMVMSKDMASIGNVFVVKADQTDAFKVFQKATSFLKGSVDGNLYGFMDYQIWGDLTGNGQQAVPCALAKPEFGKGLKGTWTLIDELRVMTDMKSFVAPTQPTWANLNGKINEGKLELKGSATATIKAGDLFTVAGVYSKKVNDTASNKLFVFRAGEDISITTSYADVSTKVSNFKYGDATGWIAPDDVEDAVVKGLLTAGKTYAATLVRASKAQVFGSMKTCDCEAVSYKKSECDGVTVHENGGADIKKFATEKRFDMIFASKLVEPRAAILILYPLAD